MKRIAVPGLVLLSWACGVRHAPPPTVEPAVTREGVTGVRLLTPEGPDASETAEAEGESLAPAIASDDNPLPDYPAVALDAGCADGLVAVRVTVNTDGNASLVREVPGHPVPTDDCHAAFWESTVAAVEQWRFAPAHRRVRERGRDVDGDGKPDFTTWDQEFVAIYLDFEFSFRVVEGRGQVVPR